MAKYQDTLELIDKVSKPLQKIQDNMSKVSKKSTAMARLMRMNMNKIGADVSKIAGAFKKVIKVVGAVALAVTAVGGILIAGAKKVADFGDRIDKMSQKIGMSRKSFQEWDYIMSQNGGNVDNLQMGFKTLTTQMGNAQKGSKDSLKAFADLGVKIKDNNGKLRTADDVFNDSIRALQKMDNQTQRNIIGNKIFGRSYADMLPLINQSAEATDKLRQKANQLGLIISDKEIDNAVKFKDTMDTLGRVLNAKFSTVMMKMMPFFTATMEKIIPIINIISAKAKEIFNQIINSPAFDMLKAQLMELGQYLMQFYNENKTFFDALGKALMWLIINGIPNLIVSIVWVISTLIKVILGLFTAIHNVFKWIGGVIGNIIGFIMDLIDRVTDAINKVIQLGATVGKAFGNLATKAKNVVTNITNNTTNNTVNNNTTNNYNAGGTPNLKYAT